MATRELTAGDGVTLTPGSGTLAVSTSAPTVSSGAGAPVSIPTAAGDIYIDTTGDNAYIAVGVASSADWEISNGAGDLLAANNLSDLADAGTARTNLGLGTAATTASTAYATAAQGALADTATQPADLGTLAAQDDIAVPGDITATGTASATTFLRGDGSWATPAGGGGSVSSGAGAPASTPSAVGDIYVDTTADEVYLATGTASAADWNRPLDVVVYDTGSEARPPAETVIWVATDAGSVSPTNAAGDDIIIPADTSLQQASNLSDLASAQTANANLRVATATITGTTDTLAAGDDARMNIYSNASAVTVTLANLTVGHETVLVSTGAGGLSVAAGGMTLLGSPNLTISQGEALFVKQTAASTWVVLGGTAA